MSTPGTASNSEARKRATGGSFWIGGREVTRDDYLALTDALEYGNDGFQSPAAHPRDLIDPLRQAMSEARDHWECPVLCELCGETLAAAICEHCYGSGCGPGTASGAYEECEWCAGVGRIHESCAEQSYADLLARAEAAESRLVTERRAAAVEALREAVADITTHNGTPVTPTNLRWAATHEALCRSFIFDVLTGLADRLAVEGPS